MNQKQILFPILISAMLTACNGSKSDIVKTNFDFATKQFNYAFEEMKLAIENESEQSIHERAVNNWSELTNPRNIEPGGELRLVPSKDWCSGFFPGEMWYMYEYTNDEKWKDLAHRRTIILEREKLNNRTHDMGFKMYCSYGNAYRITQNPAYKDVLMQSAATLITRFNPNVGCIRSWDFNAETWDFPVIIDNMMNLELLFWAWRESGDSAYYKIAVSHANTTMANHFRTDNSSYHVIDYNPVTGAVQNKHTHQGHSHESAWARGQAWGLYGFTFCYRETQNPAYLEQAKKIAHYIFSHSNMPADLIPYWDFDAPNIPDEPRDVSAAAICASALYELSVYVNAGLRKSYIEKANTILSNITKHYRARLGEQKGFLTTNSTGSKTHNSEVDVPIVYADYYFLEALLRKQKYE